MTHDIFTQSLNNIRTVYEAKSTATEFNTDFIPANIPITSEFTSGQILDSIDLNVLYNLLITQGNKSTHQDDVLTDHVNYLRQMVENLNTAVSELLI